MNLKDLKYFLAVAELNHFGQAAERCYVSQPTLSGQIKKLEEQLGVSLFERTNRRVMLTETGEQIARSARRIMLEVDAIQDIAKSTTQPLSGKFRLGAFPTLATYVFPELVRNVIENLPELRLILVEEKLLAVPSSHPFASYQQIEQTDLKNSRLLLLEEGHCLRDQALDVCQVNGVSEEQDFRATGLETLREMVKAGTIDALAFNSG